MGFTCAIYRCPKYKDLSFKNIMDINEYFHYFDNSWAQKTFSTVEKYLETYHNRVPAEDEIEFFKNKIHKDEWGSDTIYDTIESWCSNGKFLYDIITEECGTLDNDFEHSVEFRDKESVCKILSCIWKYYTESFKFYNATISNSFKTVKVEDEEEIHLRPCDGVEIKFEDGTIRREYTSEDAGYDYDEPGIVTTKNYIDAYEMENVRHVITVFINILAEVDFEKEFIAFSGGW